MVDLLRRHEVPAGVYAPESREGQRILARAGPSARLPVVEVLDGPPLSAPSLVEVVDELRPRDALSKDRYDLVTVGAGPAGLGAEERIVTVYEPDRERWSADCKVRKR